MPLPPEAAAVDEAQAAAEPLPAKLLNNAAVLQLGAGHAAEAMQLLEEAIQVRRRLASDCNTSSCLVVTRWPDADLDWVSPG